MHTIAVIGQKGGTGKTTVAVGLAVAATQQGVRCAIVDLDPQANAAAWHDNRDLEWPRVVSCVPVRLRAVLDGLRAEGVELVIIDTPGRLESAGVKASEAADLVLIPTGVQAFEVKTLPDVRDLLLMAGGRPAWIVLNSLHPSATRRAEAAREVLAEVSGLPVAPMHLCRRAAYADAPALAQGPHEYEPGGAAARELDALYKFASAHAKVRA